MGRRKYSEEFKHEAVELTTLAGATQAQVARDLGISANTLGAWIHDLDGSGEGASPGKGHSRDQEMTRLKRELARVTKERDFLRDAAAFFAKERK